jgi:hypothetical protein
MHLCSLLSGLPLFGHFSVSSLACTCTQEGKRCGIQWGIATFWKAVKEELE